MLAQGTDNTFPALRSSAAAGRGRRGNKQAKPAANGLDSGVRQTWLEFTTSSMCYLGQVTEPFWASDALSLNESTRTFFLGLLVQEGVQVACLVECLACSKNSGNVVINIVWKILLGIRIKEGRERKPLFCVWFLPLKVRIKDMPQSSSGLNPSFYR